MLTLQEQAYGQQKNREYIYTQATIEQWEYKKNWAKVFGIPLRGWDELDEFATDSRYEELCKDANITPW